MERQWDGSIKVLEKVWNFVKMRYLPPTLNSAQAAQGSQIYRKIYSPAPEECEFREMQDFSFTQRVNQSCLSDGGSHRYLEV